MPTSVTVATSCMLNQLSDTLQQSQEQLAQGSQGCFVGCEIQQR